jgi:hypothetical protein
LQRIGELAFARPQLPIRTAACEHFRMYAHVFQLRAASGIGLGRNLLFDLGHPFVGIRLVRGFSGDLRHARTERDRFLEVALSAFAVCAAAGAAASAANKTIVPNRKSLFILVCPYRQ